MNSVPLLGWGCSLTITPSTGAPCGPRTTPLHDPVEDVAEAITPEMAKISAKTVGTRSIHEVYLLKQPTRPILSDIEEADASLGAASESDFEVCEVRDGPEAVAMAEVLHPDSIT